MPIPSQTDRLDFWKHSHARSSFLQVDRFSRQLLSLGLPVFSPDRDLYTVAIIAAYCRPFKQRPRSVRLDVSDVPEEFREIHDSLEEMRDKVIAHRDKDGSRAEWGFINELHINRDSTGFEINTVSPYITDQKAEHIISLVEALLKKMNERINLFVAQFMPQLPPVTSTYVVSLESNPVDWLKKK